MFCFIIAAPIVKRCGVCFYTEGKNISYRIIISIDLLCRNKLILRNFQFVDSICPNVRRRLKIFFTRERQSMRHKTNHKTYAFLFERQGHLWVNVKAEPQWGDFWKSTYPAVVPAHHMNKRHWVSIILDGSMTEEQVFQLIAESYTLTQPKRAAKAQSE